MKGIHHMPSTTVATVAHSPAYDNLLSEALAMFLPVGVLGVSPGTFGPCQLTLPFGLSSCHIRAKADPPAIYGTLTHYPGGSTVRLTVTPVSLPRAIARGRWRCIEVHDHAASPLDCLLQWFPTVR